MRRRREEVGWWNGSRSEDSHHYDRAHVKFDSVSGTDVTMYPTVEDTTTASKLQLIPTVIM